MKAYEFKWNPHARAKIPATFLRACPEAPAQVITPEHADDFIAGQHATGQPKKSGLWNPTSFRLFLQPVQAIQVFKKAPGTLNKRSRPFGNLNNYQLFSANRDRKLEGPKMCCYDYACISHFGDDPAPGTKRP